MVVRFLVITAECIIHPEAASLLFLFLQNKTKKSSTSGQSEVKKFKSFLLGKAKPCSEKLHGQNSVL